MRGAIELKSSKTSSNKHSTGEPKSEILIASTRDSCTINFLWRFCILLFLVLLLVAVFFRIGDEHEEYFE